MKVVILARTVEEAEQYAKAAELKRRDTFAASPRSARTLYGLTLSNEDLIAELPGFREHPDAHKVIDVLTQSMRKSKTTPVWRKLGT